MRSRILFLFSVVAVAGCDHERSLAPVIEEPKEEVPWMTTAITIPEHWAKQDQCELEKWSEKRGFKFRGPPWQSYCLNPRPFKTGRMTGWDMAREDARLRREWEAKHGPWEGDAKLRDGSK